jgi:hypothetical protein
MRYGALVLFAALVIVAGTVYVFAQDRPPDGADRPGGFGPRPPEGEPGQLPERPFRPVQMPGMGGPAVMELSGSTLFLVSGTRIYKIDTNAMKVQCERDLAQASDSDESAVDAVMKKFDIDGDGKISKREFTGPERLFREMDTDSDGFVTKEEIPNDMLDRARKQARRNVGGPAAIKVGTTSLYVFLGGTLFKLKVSDLSEEGVLEVEEQAPPTLRPNRDLERQRRGDTQPGEGGEDRQKKKKEDDDFGF